MYSDDFDLMEADFASSAPPPLNVNLYEAKAFIKGHKRAILKYAYGAAKRIAKRHGPAALRHEVYQRQALRQGFIRAYLRVNPVPRDRVRARRYRRDLIAVAKRAEAELFALLNSLRGMIFRGIFKMASGGLFESDEQARRPRHAKTALVHRAHRSRQSYARRRAQMRNPRPSRRAMQRAVAALPHLRPRTLNFPNFQLHLLNVILRAWNRVWPIAHRIARSTNTSPTHNPVPAVYAEAVTALLRSRRLIGASEAGEYRTYFRMIGAAPIPGAFKFIIAAGHVLVLLLRRNRASRESFEALPMYEAKSGDSFDMVFA